MKGRNGEIVSQSKLRSLADNTIAVDLKPMPLGNYTVEVAGFFSGYPHYGRRGYRFTVFRAIVKYGHPRGGRLRNNLWNIGSFCRCLINGKFFVATRRTTLFPSELLSFGRTLLPLFMPFLYLADPCKAPNLTAEFRPAICLIATHYDPERPDLVRSGIYASLLLVRVATGAANPHTAAHATLLVASLPLVASRSLTSHSAAVRE